MKLPFFIASRYLFARKSHVIINVISWISAAGLAIGTAALIIILSVYNGFDRIIEENLSSTDPDILIRRVDGDIFLAGDTPSLMSVLDREEVEMTSGILEFEAYLKYGGHEAAGLLRGMEKMPGVQLTAGDIPQAVAGMSLAASLGIRCGRVEPLKIYFPDRKRKLSMADPASSLHCEDVFPNAVLNLGAELDDKLVIIPLESARKLYNGQQGCVNGIALYLKDNSRRAVSKFRRSVSVDEFQLLDSRRQHPELFKMMKLEKGAIFLILMIVVLIVAFNIFGSLSMLVIEKEEDTATLRALGMQDGTIRNLFLLEGWLITLTGLLAGLVAGVCISLIQQHFGLVKMPGNFLVDAYPVVLKWTDVLLSAVCVSLIGLVVAIAPSRKAVGQ